MRNLAFNQKKIPLFVRDDRRISGESSVWYKKKSPPPAEAKGGDKEGITTGNERLVVLSALLLDKFNKKLQVFRIHIRQNTVAEVENVPECSVC